MVKVISKTGKQLMPTTRYGKVRRMLKAGLAKVVCKRPFTIQLEFDTTEFTQHAIISVNPGDTTGFSAVLDNGKVVEKGIIALRTDVKLLLATRAALRRGRRFRNTRYRPARWSYRKNKKDGWLPPSIRQKAEHIVGRVREIASYFPDYSVRVEIAKFDIQKIMNPDISGIGYQRGDLYGYENVKQFLLVRDKGKCKFCHKGYGGAGNGWHVHHIIPKPKGTNKPDNLVLLHKSCHDYIHKQGLLNTLGKPKQYKAAALYNAVRNKLMNDFKSIYEDKVSFTYGYITAVRRRELGLTKEHYNDAIAISGVKTVKDNSKITVIKQVRKKKRSLHEANFRKGGKRNSKNTSHVQVDDKVFYLNDKVEFNEQVGFISGFTGKAAYIQDIDGNYIKADGKNYKQVNLTALKILRRNNNWLATRKEV